MSAAEYFEGVLYALLTLSATLAGALLLLRRRYAWLEGADRVVVYAVLATLGLLVVHLLPAILGLLTRGTVVVAALLWLAACWRVPAAEAEATPGPEPEPPAESRWGVGAIAAAAAVGLTALLTLAFARSQLTAAPDTVDFVSFHLPNVARWIQSGSIWQIDDFLPLVTPGNYPNNGDVMLLAATLPWRNDFLAQFAIYPFFLLTGIATYALARALGAVRAAAAVAGCLAIVLPAIAISSLVNGMTDAVMLFAFTAGVLLLVRHHRSGRTAELVLAGLALGVALGTKWYGVSSVAIVFVVWAGASLLAGREPRTVLRQGGAIVGLVTLAGGVWLLRNWILSGNPFFPVRLAPFGITIFDAPPDLVRERAGWSIADYFGEWDAWREYIVPAYRQALAAPGALIGAGFLLAMGLLAVRRWRPPRPGVLAAGVAAALLLAAAYAITPYTAGGPDLPPLLVGPDSRYLIPALIVAGALAAWAAGRLSWGVPALGVLGLVAVVDGARCVSSTSCFGTSEGLAHVELATRDWLAAALALLLLIGVAWGVPRLRTRFASPRAPGPVALGAVGAVVAALALAGGYEVQKRFNDGRYKGYDPVIDAVIERAPGDLRIGLAGLWTDAGLSPILPSFGERLDNEVAYVGPRVQEMLMRYPTRGEFVSALERGDYDYLVVGHTRPPEPPPPEGEWAETAGFEEIVHSDRLALYRPAAVSG